MQEHATGFMRCAMTAVRAVLGSLGIAVCAAAQPANDDCFAPTAVMSPGVYSATTEGASGFTNSPCGLPNDFFDVWFSFTAPAAGAYRFDLQLSPGYVGATMALYDECAGVALACDDGPDSGPTAGKPDITYPLAAGRTILIRVAMCCGDRWPFTLRVGPGVLSPIPPNDECSGAIPLAIDTPTQGNNIDATGGLRSTPCIFAFNDTRDVWYSFTAPSSGHFEFKSRGLTSVSFNPFYTTLALFAACGGEQLACGNDQNPESGSRIVHPLTAGQSVWVRVAGWAGGEGTFEVEVSASQPVAPPPNDLCEAARQIVALPYSDSVNVAGATDDAPSACSTTAMAELGVWWTLVPPRDTNIIVLNDSAIPISVSVFTAGAAGDCELAQEIGCYTIVPGGGHTGQAGTELLAGQRYWIMLAHLGDRPLSADATIAPRIIPRGLDTCARAEPLPFPASIEGGNFTFTDEGIDAACGPDRGVDVWYEFVAPAAAVYRFELLDRPRPPFATMEGAVISLYDRCGGTELACDANAAGGSTVSVLHAMVAGQRVMVRAASNFALWGTFALEVSSTAPAGPSPHDDCANAIAWPAGVGAKIFIVNGSTASASQQYTGTFASAAAALGEVTLHSDTWYRWTSPATGILGVRTNIAGIGIAVYGGGACPPASGSLLNATVGDTDLFVPVTGGQQLLFQIGSIGTDGSAVAHVHLALMPYQGACCTSTPEGSACSVRLSAECTGTFMGANTVCGPVGAQSAAFADPTIVEIPQSSTPALRTIGVPAAGAFSVGALAVQVTLNHTELSDVVLTLSHGGRTLTLVRASGVPNHLSGLYILTDASLNPLSLAYAGATRYPAAGGYYRASNIATFTNLDDPATGFGGMTSAGEWTLGVRDAFAPNRGWLGGWRLILLPANAAGPCASQSIGACCRGSTCAAATATACGGPNVRFAGAFTACNVPGEWRTPCCIADFDQTAESGSLQDLFTFLAAWFGNDPASDADGSGGPVSVGDLFAFLAAWFAGC